MRSQIKADYLRYLDLFHMSFLATLVHHNTGNTPLVTTTVMENSLYGKKLEEMYKLHINNKNILSLFNPADTFVLVDIQIYLLEFLSQAHNFKEYNFYNITIDPKYNILITNKQLGRYVI